MQGLRSYLLGGTDFYPFLMCGFLAGVVLVSALLAVAAAAIEGLPPGMLFTGLYVIMGFLFGMYVCRWTHDTGVRP